MEPADTEAPRVFTVTEEARTIHRRLDQWLVSVLPDLSRTTVKRLFEDENITAVSGVKLNLNKMPAVGTEIEIEVPPPVDTDLVPQNIPLDILFEDEHLIVLVKPAGLCVHPSAGHPDMTLVNAVLYHCPDLQGVGGEKRPGIVHRLDLGTSGVMVVAKTHAAHEGMVQLFSTHDIERVYEVIVWGIPKPSKGTITTFIGRHPNHRQKMSCEIKAGKKAITHFGIVKSAHGVSHIRCQLHTGRTHQIRVHMSQHLKTPVICDPLYANVPQQRAYMTAEMNEVLAGYPHQLLHARVLGFKHPITGEALRFEHEAPAPFAQILELMG